MMKNIKIFSIIGGLILTTGCVKDYKSFTQSKLINNTAHTIMIQAYKDGAVDSKMMVTLAPYETKTVFEDSPWGKTLAPNWATFLQPYDSTIVWFDGLFKRSKHLRFTDTMSCDYCIPFASNRNISNEANYVKTITKEEKKYLNGYFTYTFSEQDYLDAK